MKAWNLGMAYSGLELCIPSMSTLRASLSTLRVERRTRIQKMNVQMGSAIVHFGCTERNIKIIIMYGCSTWLVTTFT